MVHRPYSEFRMGGRTWKDWDGPSDLLLGEDIFAVQPVDERVTVWEQLYQRFIEIGDINKEDTLYIGRVLKKKKFKLGTGVIQFKERLGQKKEEIEEEEELADLLMSASRKQRLDSFFTDAFSFGIFWHNKYLGKVMQLISRVKYGNLHI